MWSLPSIMTSLAPGIRLTRWIAQFAGTISSSRTRRTRVGTFTYAVSALTSDWPSALKKTLESSGVPENLGFESDNLLESSLKLPSIVRPPIAIAQPPRAHKP